MAEPKKELRLHSPVGGEALVYSWPLVKTKHYDPATEIIETIRMVMNQYEELKTVMNKFCRLDEIDRADFDAMKNLCDKFSKAADTIRNLWKGQTHPGNERSGVRADLQMLRLIVTLAYNRAVTDPESLNHHYEAFSSETYGETSFNRLHKIIEEIGPRDRDVFVDLGSGVGQVVVHMAGGSKCKKCIGIEIADVPGAFAETLSAEFTRWMKWYGKKWRHFELIKGDFLHEQFRELITKEATIIFINNYAFTPDLEHRIKTLLLQELKDGTRIISTKPYCPLNVRITDRHMSDIAAILDIRELTPCVEPCSWTSNNVQYYLHTINRSKLEQYFLTRNDPLEGNGGGLRRSWSKSSSSRSSRESSESNGREQLVHKSVTHTHPMMASSSAPILSGTAPVAEDDSAVYGPTTRRQWNVWVSEQQRHKKTKEHHSRPSLDFSESDDSGGKKRKGGRGRPKGKLNGDRVRLKPKLPSPKQKIQYAKPMEGEEGLEKLHSLTMEMTAGSSSPSAMDVHVSSLPKAQSSSTHLDEFLSNIRRQYEDQLQFMQTDEFKASIFKAIEAERARKEQLKQRAEYLEGLVKSLQHEGVTLLKQRMRELNIQAETPAELLNQAKEIVVRHKDLQSKATLLEKEVDVLHFQNQNLVQCFRERDEQTVQSGILSSLACSTLDTAKDTILREIGMAFSVKKALLSEVTKLETEVIALQTNLSPNLAALMEPAAGTMPSPAQTQPLATPTQTASQSLAPTVPSGLPPKHRRGRGRNGSGPGRAKRPSNSVSGCRDRNMDPKQQEEMERQIQDIVQKALSVDNAAKTAEKERKARTAERKKTAATTTRPVVTSAGQAMTPPTPQGTTASSTQVCPQVATFSSAGLVPVYSSSTADSEESRKRKRSVSSSSTESAPSEQTDEERQEAKRQLAAATVISSRPSSVPASSHKFRIEHLMSSSSLDSAREHSASAPMQQN